MYIPERRLGPPEIYHSGICCEKCGYEFEIDEEAFVEEWSGEWLCEDCAEDRDCYTQIITKRLMEEIHLGI